MVEEMHVYYKLLLSVSTIQKSYVITVLKGVFCVPRNDTYGCHGWENISSIWDSDAITVKFYVSPGDVERLICKGEMAIYQFGIVIYFFSW